MKRLRIIRIATLVATTVTIVALINAPDVLPPGIRGLTAGVLVGLTALVYRETTRREGP